MPKEFKGVAVVVSDDRANPIKVIPEVIRINRMKDPREHARWYVLNNTEVDISVTIEGKDPSTHELFAAGNRPPFTLAISAGDHERTPTARSGARDGFFEYKITVRRSDGAAVPVYDPMVIISGGGGIHVSSDDEDRDEEQEPDDQKPDYKDQKAKKSGDDQ